MKKLSYVNLVLSFIALMGFWLIMSGIYQPMQIAQGVISVAIVMAVNHKLKLHKFFDDEMDDLRLLRFYYVPVYVIWLLKEIILAGLHVATVIIFPGRQVETYILKFKVDLPSAHARMILGNSITLTPGTLTIDITEDEYIVHALTPKSFEAITSDIMPRKVLKLFSTEEIPVIYDIQILNKSEQIKQR